MWEGCRSFLLRAKRLSRHLAHYYAAFLCFQNSFFVQPDDVQTGPTVTIQNQQPTVQAQGLPPHPDLFCNECNRTFSAPSSKKRHIRNVHENQRDYKCDFCTKAYTCKQNLKLHIQKKHGATGKTTTNKKRNKNGRTHGTFADHSDRAGTSKQVDRNRQQQPNSHSTSGDSHDSYDSSPNDSDSEHSDSDLDNSDQSDYYVDRGAAAQFFDMEAHEDRPKRKHKKRPRRDASDSEDSSRPDESEPRRKKAGQREPRGPTIRAPRQKRQREPNGQSRFPYRPQKGHVSVLTCLRARA